MHKRRRKISIIPYLFVAPVIILLLVFNIAPMFVGFRDKCLWTFPQHFQMHVL